LIDTKRSLIFIVFIAVLLPVRGEARFASQFSLSVGEEYNDNIFFLKQREHDFITHITPTLTLLYQPASQLSPTFRFDISPTGQIFARHSEENNFGENLRLGGGYNYNYSPRLSFHLTDTLQLQGDTRTAGVGEGGILQLPRTPTAPPAPGLTRSQSLGDFISNGRTLANRFAVGGRYLYAPDITIGGEYNTGYTSFLDRGGTELSHSAGLRGVYKWGREHNLHAGYTIDVIKSREGETNVVHNFDVGDDYFSTTQIQLTPTLTLAGSTGISLNAGNDGPRVANNTNVTVTKLWETASLSVGARRGLTNSFGVSGLSETTTFFTGFNIRLTERLSGNAGVDYSLFDTEDVNFKTLQASTGLQYAVTNWLCSSLRYSHRRLYSGSGAENTDLLTRGNVYGNSVFLNFSAHFDVWPTMGLARGSTSCPLVVPTGAARPSQGMPQ
jgi:hypothetical protein